MKRFLFAAALIAAAAPVFATDVGVSISIGQPGFYGRIDIGDFPQPQVIYAQPIVVEHVPLHRPPIYMRVPPGHAKHWHKHCHEYNACGERVYFVRDAWYHREYVPRYQERHRVREEWRRDERRDDRRDDRKDGNRKGRGNDDSGDSRKYERDR